jgi:hypothetical protein
MDLISLSNLVTSGGQWYQVFAKSDDRSPLTDLKFYFPVNFALVIQVMIWYYPVFC